MAEIKTQKNSASVKKFLENVSDKEKRDDSFVILKMMEEITGEKAKMWGTSLVGFGSYHYTSERSKQEGDWPITAFSPRKQNITVYIMPGFKEYSDLLKKLGKHKTSVSCLYFKRLSDLDIKILKKLITESVKYMRKKYKV